MTKGRGVVINRGLQSVASTLVSGLSNLVIQLLASTVLSVTAFAEFSIVATTIIFGLGLGRAAVGQSDILRGERDSHRGPADAALTVGGVLLVLSAALAIGGAVGHNALLLNIALGVALTPLFVLQDALRFRSFRAGRPSVALISDIALLAVVLITMFPASSIADSGSLLAVVWASGTAFGLAVGAVLLRYLPRSLPEGARWLATNRDLVLPGAGEYLLQSTIPYVLNFAILAVGGAEALAGYRLVQLVFAALGNFASGLNAAMLPPLVESGDPRRARRDAGVEVVVLTGMSLLLLSAMYFLPASWGAAVFGESWSGALPFVLVASLHGWINALGVPNFSLLRLLGRARFSFGVRVVSVGVTVAASLIAMATGSAVAIAWAIALPATAGYFTRLFVSQKLLASLISKGERIAGGPVGYSRKERP